MINSNGNTNTNNNNNNNHNHHDPFDMVPLVDCFKLKTIALYCVFIFLTGTMFNSILLWIFYKYKELRTPMNGFIIALTVLNLTGCITEMPIVILSNFYCKYTAVFFVVFFFLF